LEGKIMERCAYCGEDITNEPLTEVDGEWLCPNCLEEEAEIEDWRR